MWKTVTYNLRYNNDKDGNSIRERAPRLKRVLGGYDADLMGFQEILPEWMGYLQRDYNGTYEIFAKYRGPGENSEAAPVLWRRERFECLDRGYFWLSETPDRESCWYHEGELNRICTWVKLRDKQEGACFTYFNTHLGFGDREQLMAARLILARIAEIADGRAILTGDFNLHKETAAYRELTRVLTDCNEATAKDRRPTYHDYNRNCTDSEKLIDFCFVTPETMRPIASKRMDEMVEGGYVSDHWGVYSEIIPV